MVIGVIGLTPPGRAFEDGVEKKYKDTLDTEVKGFRWGVGWFQRLGEGVLGGHLRSPAFPGPPGNWGLS